MAAAASCRMATSRTSRTTSRATRACRRTTRRCWWDIPRARSMAYAMLAQAPAGTFVGALSLGFCVGPGSRQAAVPRRRRALHAAQGRQGRGPAAVEEPAGELGRVPRRARPGLPHGCRRAVSRRRSRARNSSRLPKVAHAYPVTGDWLPRFLVAYDSTAAKAAAALPPPPASLADLPLVEVRATQRRAPRSRCCCRATAAGPGLDKNVAGGAGGQGRRRRRRRFAALLLEAAHAAGTGRRSRSHPALLRRAVEEVRRAADRLFAGRGCAAVRDQPAARARPRGWSATAC